MTTTPYPHPWQGGEHAPQIPLLTKGGVPEGRGGWTSDFYLLASNFSLLASNFYVFPASVSSAAKGSANTFPPAFLVKISTRPSASSNCLWQNSDSFMPSS